MAHPNDQSKPTSQALRTMNDMPFGFMGMHSQRRSKDIGPPPVDLFSSSSGMYIPPEEFKQNEPSLEEIMGWGMSDDQQDTEEEDDDDEMDDNEFDLEFEEADYPPPIRPEDQTPGLFQRNFLQIKFNVLQSTPYVPPHSSIPYPAFVNRENTEQPMEFDSTNAAPVQFINPSSLHLPFQWPCESMENHPYKSPTDAMNRSVNFGSSESFSSYTPTMHASYPGPSISSPPKIAGDDDFVSAMDSSHTYSHLHSGESSDLSAPDLELGANEIEVGMDMSDLYLPTPDNHVDPFEKNGIMSSPLENPQSAPEQDFIEDSSAVSPVASSSARTPVEIASSPKPSVTERPNAHHKRKTTRKRATFSHRSSPSSSSHLTPHVCNMTFSDGSECHRSFTRPYDLARHQETLHAAVRKMYTCEVCGTHSKTFSRLDALSRHMRLKH